MASIRGHALGVERRAGIDRMTRVSVEQPGTALALGSHHGAMGVIRRRSFNDPDAVHDFPLAEIRVARIGSHSIGYGVEQPGWRWSTHMGPGAGTTSCPIHHVQVFLSGRFAVRMDDGEEVEFGPLDVGDIPPGHDAWVVGDEPVHILDIAGNSDAIGMPREHERIVSTLLMTDIVDSTRTAHRLGDGAWKQVLSDHNRLVRAQLLRFGGSEVNTTGDGFLATFRSAVAALRCAAAIVAALPDAGIEARIGIHTGEIEPMGRDIGGVAVHVVARIMALAGPSEVFASAVTIGLADGSGLAFEGQGDREVKGLDRPVEVYRLV